MISLKQIKTEHRKAINALADLEDKASEAGHAVDGDLVLHKRLIIIRDMLEWVHSPLVKPDPARGRIDQLLGDSRYYGMGPVDTELTWRR
jgi:hypothetical protein